MRTFWQLEGSFRLVESQNAESDDDKSLGSLSYYEKSTTEDSHDKASYHLHVRIPKRLFDILLDAISQGRLPAEISIFGVGMFSDWRPHKRKLSAYSDEKIWGIESCSYLRITSITFGDVLLIGGDPHKSLDDQTLDNTQPPTSAQFNVLLEKINYLVGSSKRTVVCLIVMICLLLVVVLRGC